MDEILTISEIAIRLKLAERTVYAMAAAGELPAFKLRGQWRMRQSDFERWLEAVARGEQGDTRKRTFNGGSAMAENIPSSVDNEELEAVAESHLAVSKLTERVSQVDMHRRLIDALGKRVLANSPIDQKPLEIDLGPPIPVKARVYMYNATRPPGGRPLGEHKVQLIVPGQSRGERGSFDHGRGRIVLLIGYAAEEDIFILWDAGLYSNFAWSRNVQVKAETIIEATAGKLAAQFRQLRPGSGRPILETLIAAPSGKLSEAIDRRVQLTRDRLIES